ncbi:hypothetical protein [Cyclobacterium salsum]|uniref:hypothetical protein n=1 Tax=Cyclobacterium salsum TaxID=2666329 RepID=UPI001391D0F4|nr:hypothetical protein [Cyclobacterium salsum]
MILGFKTHIHGKPTYFKEKILAPYTGNQDRFRPKIHTIRKGFRWKEGMRIHMATGIRTKNYHQFNQGIPQLEHCTGTQDIWIYARDQRILVWEKDRPEASETVTDGSWKELDKAAMQELALNDGFDSLQELFDWFFPIFGGQIVHWTGVRH